MPDLNCFDVETPLGTVHLVGFSMLAGGSQKLNHREVVFEILSRVAGCPVTAADLQESSENPRPEFPKLNFDVNWTHSAGYCVVAYGDAGVPEVPYLRIGVDLERYSPKRLKLADRFYSAEEAEYLRGLASLGGGSACSGDLAVPTFQETEFFRLWCRKEALYKCVGGSFFEGSVGRNLLNSPVMAGPAGAAREVHLVDLDGKRAVGLSAALCIAVSRQY